MYDKIDSMTLSGKPSEAFIFNFTSMVGDFIVLFWQKQSMKETMGVECHIIQESVLLYPLARIQVFVGLDKLLYIQL